MASEQQAQLAHLAGEAAASRTDPPSAERPVQCADLSPWSAITLEVDGGSTMESTGALSDTGAAVPQERTDWRREPTRVLVVDDDPGQRMLCAVSLQRDGLTVLEAEDGLRALELARAERPDLILTDVMMPAFDGFQLAEALRRDDRTSEIPLIFLSGEATPGNGTRARELGAVAYVRKPFDPPALASLVEGALTRAGTWTPGAGSLGSPVA